jgi:heparinase II/III-like protein
LRIFGKKRDAAEIRYRLRQEVRNLKLWIRPPCLSDEFEAPTPLPGLPDPGVVCQLLRASSFDTEISNLAERIRGHNFPILGTTVETGPGIRWRRDYSGTRESGAHYFRLIPYLNQKRTGDHKVIWEVNRHQHLVVLAQDYCLHGNRESIAEIATQLESWIEQNPFQCGINWTSALEVALRVLSWTWLWHLAGEALSPTLRGHLLEQIYRHGWHLETNLSYYFSPNTHLLGEAVALHALGVLFAFPESKRWADTGSRVVQRQMDAQVRDDGTHFEQSTYYQLYALDMFLFHAVLANPGDAYRDKLGRMAQYLDALSGPSRSIPFLGDDDGGRFFHPYGEHAQYGRATLATCSVFLDRTEWPSSSDDLAAQAAWWLGRTTANKYMPPRDGSQLFVDAGVAVLRAGDLQVIVDAGPFGTGSAGHSHSDSLGIIARTEESEILIDPGTYTYVGDPAWRDHFRGSASHNIIRIDALDQAKPSGPFRWISKPEVIIREWLPGPLEDILDAECRYKGFVHRRRVVFLKSGALFVLDTIRGPHGGHDVEQFWHLCKTADVERFSFSEKAELIQDWRSPAFGRKIPAAVVRIRLRSKFPCRIAAGIALRPGRIAVLKKDGRFQFIWQPEDGTTPCERVL